MIKSPLAGLDWQDAICLVLANNRQASTVYAVLAHFLPNHSPLTEDFYLCDEDLGLAAPDEAAMLRHFQTHSRLDATRYWKAAETTAERVMVGAHFTTDARLVMSVTLDGDEATVDRYLAELKQVLHSNIGFIYGAVFPPFQDGADFERLAHEANN
jgi:hypothetical protein